MVFQSIFLHRSLVKTFKNFSNILRFIILRHVQLLCNLFPSSLLDNFCCVCLVCNLKCFQYSCFSCIWEESSFAFSKMFFQSIAVSTDSWEKMDGWRCCCAGFALHFAATLLKLQRWSSQVDFKLQLWSRVVLMCKWRAVLNFLLLFCASKFGLLYRELIKVREQEF